MLLTKILSSIVPSAAACYNNKKKIEKTWENFCVVSFFLSDPIVQKKVAIDSAVVTAAAATAGADDEAILANNKLTCKS